MFWFLYHTLKKVNGLKQRPRGALRKMCSENMQQIYRRTPMPKCDFNKVALHLYWNHTLAWVLSCKFAFQNNFFHKHLWRTTTQCCFFNYQSAASRLTLDFEKLFCTILPAGHPDEKIGSLLSSAEIPKRFKSATFVSNRNLLSLYGRMSQNGQNEL